MTVGLHITLCGVPTFTLGKQSLAGILTEKAFFVERAQRADRTFQLTLANQGTVLAICRFVEGLPLGFANPKIRGDMTNASSSIKTYFIEH